MREITAYIALGANIGDPRENLRTAARLLEKGGLCISGVSSLYKTRPVGVLDQPDFLNAVIEVKTTLNPRELLNLCLKTEETLGRKRTIRWGPRVIDIDILLYDDLTIDEENLMLPHPRMMERAFVMAPLAEIAPDLIMSGQVTAQNALMSIDREGVEIAEGRSWVE